MDSEALKTFVTVHRLGGVTGAARALHRSQPAISRRIALLEEDLGVALFERAGGRSVLSDAGRALLPHAERVLASIKDAESAVRALASPDAGAVALAVVGTLAGTRLSRALKRFARAHPRVDLRLRTATSAEVSDLVRRGEATLGLRYDHDRAPDIECTLLRAEALKVVCAPDHALARRRVGRLAGLRDESWIAFPEVPGKREITASHVLALFRTHGLGEVDLTAVDSLTAQKRLIEAGFGVALLAQSHVAEELDAGTLATIAVGDLEAHQEITLVTRRDGYLSAAARRLIGLLRESHVAPGRRKRGEAVPGPG